MMKILAAALLVLAGAAAWMGMPSPGAAETNRLTSQVCLDARLRQPAGPLPAQCHEAYQREGWRTEWLLIAAVLGTGGIIVLAIGRRRTG